MKRFLLILLPLATFFLFINRIFGLTYNNIGEIRNVTQQLVSTNYGNAPYENPINSGYSFGQVLQVDYIISNYSFSADTNYQLESNLPNQVFTNANYYSVVGANGENCIISYDNSILNNDHYPRWAFQCPHATQIVTISIKNSSNEYLWSGNGIFNWSTALLKSSDTPLSTGSNDTDTIINNQNQNTQNIINNQNQNTQDIINNQNQNTQDIINSNKSCTYIGKSDATNSGYLDSSGILHDSSYTSTTDYIRVYTSQELSIVEKSSVGNPRLCFYDKNKTNISCVLQNDNTIDVPITLSSNVYYLRMTIQNETSLPQYKLCSNGSQAVTDVLDDDDTSGATSEASDFFESFTTETFGLTSIITAPLSLIQSLTSKTCTSLHLPLPYLDNKYLDLPCMSDIYSQYFGSFFTLYQTITYGIIAYWVCVRIFNLVKDFKNPEHDEIEVLDL